MNDIYVCILWIAVLICITIIAIVNRICNAVERKYAYYNAIGKGVEAFVTKMSNAEEKKGNDAVKYTNKYKDNSNG